MVREKIISHMPKAMWGLLSLTAFFVSIVIGTIHNNGKTSQHVKIVAIIIQTYAICL
jgi:hypothetical protein